MKGTSGKSPRVDNKIERVYKVESDLRPEFAFDRVDKGQSPIPILVFAF